MFLENPEIPSEFPGFLKILPEIADFLNKLVFQFLRHCELEEDCAFLCHI